MGERVTTLSSRLRSIVEVRDLRQQDIADRSGLSQGFISDVLTGKRRISAEALDQLLNGMGVIHRAMRHRLHRAGARDAGWDIGR